AADEVHYDARVLGNRGDDRIEVELAVVPRTTLEAALAALSPLAPTLAGVDAADAAGRPPGINRLGGAGRHRAVDPWRGRDAVLLLVAALALAAAMGQMLANRRAAADEVARQAEQPVREARAASLEKRRRPDLVEGGAFLQSARAG